jgi:hypothetical protein
MKIWDKICNFLLVYSSFLKLIFFLYEYELTKCKVGLSKKIEATQMIKNWTLEHANLEMIEGQVGHKIGLNWRHNGVV